MSYTDMVRGVGPEGLEQNEGKDEMRSRKRITPHARAVMAPFVEQLQHLYAEIDAAIQDAERGPELIAAAVQYSQSNCYWLDYKLAGLIEMATTAATWDEALAKWEGNA